MKKLVLMLGLALGLIGASPSSSYREFYDGADALNWGNTILAGSIFSPEEQNIIFDYSKGSSIFNNKLRAGEKLENLPPEEQNKIRALDSALNKMITFENIKVYRYEKILFLERLCSKAMLYEKIYSNTRFLQGAEAYLDKCLIDNVYEDFGFMSTTMIRHAVFIHRPIELIIKVPKYSDGLFIARNGFSFFIQEYEILFPRNRKLKVKSYEISQDRKKITIETLMEGPLWLINGELVRPEE